MSISKAGRKRKNVHRYPSGQIRKNTLKDGPTLQHETKRKTMVAGGNPVRSSTPLDVLLERKIITLDQHTAGEEYAKRYRAVCGMGFAKTIGAEGGTMENTIEEGEVFVDHGPLQYAEPMFREMASALESLGRRSKDEVDNCCVYERFPKFIFTDQPASKRLLMGLTVLSGVVKGSQRAA